MPVRGVVLHPCRFVWLLLAVRYVFAASSVCCRTRKCNKRERERGREKRGERMWKQALKKLSSAFKGDFLSLALSESVCKTTGLDARKYTVVSA